MTKSRSKSKGNIICDQKVTDKLFYFFSSRLYKNKQKEVFYYFFDYNFVLNLELYAVRDSLCQFNESQQHFLYFPFL